MDETELTRIKELVAVSTQERPNWSAIPKARLSEVETPEGLAKLMAHYPQHFCSEQMVELLKPHRMELSQAGVWLLPDSFAPAVYDKTHRTVHVSEGVFIATNPELSYVATKHATVIAPYGGTVKAFQNARVAAGEDAVLSLYGNALAYADSPKLAEATGFATLWATGTGDVKAGGRSTVCVDGYTSVSARGNAKVWAEQHAVIVASDEVSVDMKDKCVCNCMESVSVVARGDSAVYIEEGHNVDVLASDSCEVYVDDKTLTGIIQVNNDAVVYAGERTNPLPPVALSGSARICHAQLALEREGMQLNVALYQTTREGDYRMTGYAASKQRFTDIDVAIPAADLTVKNVNHEALVDKYVVPALQSGRSNGMKV